MKRNKLIPTVEPYIAERYFHFLLTPGRDRKPFFRRYMAEDIVANTIVELQSGGEGSGVSRGFTFIFVGPDTVLNGITIRGFNYRGLDGGAGTTAQQQKCACCDCGPYQRALHLFLLPGRDPRVAMMPLLTADEVIFLDQFVHDGRGERLDSIHKIGILGFKKGKFNLSQNLRLPKD